MDLEVMASPGFERVWGAWLDQALLDLGRLQLNRKLLSINSSVHSARDGCSKLRVENLGSLENVETFEALGPWDRETVDMTVSQSDFTEWLGGDSSTGQLYARILYFKFVLNSCTYVFPRVKRGND